VAREKTIGDNIPKLLRKCKQISAMVSDQPESAPNSLSLQTLHLTSRAFPIIEMSRYETDSEWETMKPSLSKISVSASLDRRIFDSEGLLENQAFH
jgi:hypothetical protein